MWINRRRERAETGGSSSGEEEASVEKRGVVEIVAIGVRLQSVEATSMSVGHHISPLLFFFRKCEFVLKQYDNTKKLCYLTTLQVTMWQGQPSKVRQYKMT